MLIVRRISVIPAWLVGAALLCGALSGTVRAQDAEVRVTWDPIPLAGYKSWSLFLVCNDDWALPQGSTKIRGLFEQFLSFGKAIGPRHVAVWLAASRSSPTRIDSARSERFCANLGLPQREGPYVVLTGRYPGAAITERPETFNTDLGNHLVLSLNGISAAETTRLLEAVAKQLGSSDLQNADIDSEEFWRLLQKAFKSSDDPLLSKVSVTFATSYFSTAIAQPSGALVSALKPSQSPIPSGSTWSAKKADRSPARLTAFVADSTGLQFDAGKNGYSGAFVVALQNLDDLQDHSALAEPVTIAVKAAGGSFKPTPVRLARLLEWADIEVSVPDPGQGKYAVSVSAGPGDKGGSVELAVIRPRIALSAASTRILGWGLGTTQITVSARAYAGGLINLTAEGGFLESGSVKLDAGGNGVTTLRSDSSSSAIVGVDPAQGEVKPLTVTFRAPYIFLAAAISGGLIGAFLRGRGRKKWPKALAIGVASAIVLTIGQAVGFTSWIATVLGSDRLATSGEALVFFLGAIAALAGVSVLIPGASRKT